MSKDVSVVISCSDDYRVFRTIESVDCDAEIVCTITPNSKIQDRLDKLHIRYCLTPKGNHSDTVNAGIKLSSEQKLILIDSDCVFAPGTLNHMVEALDSYEVVNAKVEFLRRDWITGLTSQCREFDYFDGFPDYKLFGPPIFRPGIGFRKSIVNKLGHWFDPRIPWTEDAELTYRIHRSGISIFHSQYAIVQHEPVNISHHLKAYFLYGKGDRLREIVLQQKYAQGICSRLHNRYSSLVQHPASKVSIVLLSDLFYWLGYVSVNRNG